MKTDQYQLDFDEAYQKFLGFARKRRAKMMQQATTRRKDRGLTREEGRGQEMGGSRRQRRQLDVAVRQANIAHTIMTAQKAEEKAKKRKKAEGLMRQLRQIHEKITVYYQAGKTAQQLRADIQKFEKTKKIIEKLGLRVTMKLPQAPPKAKVKRVSELEQSQRRMGSILSSRMNRSAIGDIRKRRKDAKEALIFMKEYREMEKSHSEIRHYEVEKGKQQFTAMMNTIESLYQSKKFNQADLQMREAHEVLTAMQAWMPVVPVIPSLTDYSDTTASLKRQP